MIFIYSSLLLSTRFKRNYLNVPYFITCSCELAHLCTLNIIFCPYTIFFISLLIASQPKIVKVHAKQIKY